MGGEMEPDRAKSWELLCEWTQSDSLRKHARAVEEAMRAYAEKYGEDIEKWGVTGLLHDFDYERYPDQRHPALGSEELARLGYPEDVRHAILAHADYTGVQRESLLDRALFACDELAGFLTACALVRPDKSFNTLEVSSVKKKIKDKAFARTVNRDDLWKGPEELGVSFDEHCGFLISVLKGIQTELGLGLNPQTS